MNDVYSTYPEWELALETTAKGYMAEHMLPVTGRSIMGAGRFRFYFNHPVRIYASAGTSVKFLMRRYYTGQTGNAKITLSGYLIDVI